MLVYLIKQDDSKPFGEFDIEVLFSEVADDKMESAAISNLLFVPNVTPLVLHIKKNGREPQKIAPNNPEREEGRSEEQAQSTQASKNPVSENSEQDQK